VPRTVAEEAQVFTLARPGRLLEEDPRDRPGGVGRRLICRLDG